MTISDGKLFKKVVPHKNFMTPTVINYYENNQYELELSKGTGFSHDTIYGITVVSKVAEEHDSELSNMFDSYSRAVQYMKTL